MVEVAFIHLGNFMDLVIICRGTWSTHLARYIKIKNLDA